MSLLASIGLLGLAAVPATAFWRLPCKAPIVVERSDPIVSPGLVSNHLHTIMGGNGFDYVMDYNSTQASTCSSCTVEGDNSNYWVPTLWYHGEDGTFEPVPQIGGMTVYYLQRGKNGEKLKSFPPGFRMVAGDPFLRSEGTGHEREAISYACLDYNGPAKPETPGFPNYNCPNGLRAQVFFPSCWNGVDLDTKDHKSHMSYPVEAYNSGSCPDGFPVHFISIFFETLWDTGKFANRWYGNKQPFVFSMGDPTGFGGHGDFVMGWEEQHLQRAVDTCLADSGRVEDCPEFNLIPDSQAEGCSVPSRVDEPTTGKLSALPGCNPVQEGPNRAEVKTGCGATTELGEGIITGFKDLTGEGWGYMGCGTDDYYNRILTGANTAKDDMTNEQCVAFCEGKGFSIAGTEYSKECYCGNSIPDSGAPIPGVPGNCKMECAGDESQMCGGGGTITLYKKCSGGACENASFGVKPGNSVVVPSSGSGSSPASSSAASAPSSTPETAPSSPSEDGTVSILPVTDTTTAVATPTPTPDSGDDSSTPPSSPSDISGWSYKGCLLDTVSPRTLPNWSNFNGPNMSNAACVEFCDSRGFVAAGTEYAGQCWCGSAEDLGKAGAGKEEECDTECTGKKGEMCGGAARLSVYAKEANAKRSGHIKRHVHSHGVRGGQVVKRVAGGVREQI
jgi:hypothetical protein